MTTMKINPEQGDKVVCRGIAGTFWSFAGENQEETVILLGAPQSDGARTILVKTEDVEVVKSPPRKKSETSASSVFKPKTIKK